RLRWDLRRRFLGLDQDVADLRAVAVHDDQLVAGADDLSEPARGLLGPRDLLLLRAVVLGPQKGISAEGHDGELAVSGHSSSSAQLRHPERSEGSQTSHSEILRCPPRLRGSAAPATQ